MSHPLFDKHSKTLQDAVAATRSRTYWSAYPEIPSGKIYGETAKGDAKQAFESRLNNTFAIDLPGSNGTVGSEISPYGIELNISYPKCDLPVLLTAAEQAMPSWQQAGVEARLGTCLEILHRINQRSFELANAVMHTTGQGFMMAFQAGGPHAQDRGLEALAYAYEEMTRCPASVQWEKKVSKTDVVKLRKTFHLVPRGVAVVIGCSTFPTWNTYPGLFASLACGNAVVVKPHPGAILPLAITVDIARSVLKEQGFDPNLVTLAADSHDAPITKELVTHPAVRIVDYTGGSAFGDWVEQNASQAVVFTEKAGINSVILDSVEDLKAVTGNIAFSLSLYSGQMCTAPQNIFLPRGGIRVAGKQASFDDVAGGIVKALDWLLGDPNRAAEILGGIQADATVLRIEQAAAEGPEVLRASQKLEHPQFPNARVHSPVVIKVDAKDDAVFMREAFGPIVYIIATNDTAHSIELAKQAAEKHGAITSSVYSTDESVMADAEREMIAVGAATSFNLTGQIFVNQSAAFSDFHVSGANPAGNATLCDAAFVANRFRIVQSRVLVTD